MLLSTILLLAPTIVSAIVLPNSLPDLTLQTFSPSDYSIALPSLNNPYRVPLTLGVMSKCPDAFLMEALLDKVFKDERLKDKTDLEIVYIATLNKPNGEIVCKHGAEECTANIQQLCTQRYLGQSDWWEFINCENYDSRRIGSDSLARECAKSSEFEWKGDIERCVEGKEGKQLLQDSVTRAFELGIEKSATLLIGEEHRVRCIHDGTWKDCDAGHTVNDLVKSILNEYEHERP